MSKVNSTLPFFIPVAKDLITENESNEGNLLEF